MAQPEPFQFDLISFALGFTAATLFWWLFLRTRKSVPNLVNLVKTQAEKIRQRNFINVDRYIRRDILKRAQHQHLAHKLFSLNDILVEPRLLVPDGDFDITDPHRTRSLAASTIPYQPDFPEITSQYPYPTISMEQAIKKKANLAIIGSLGAGKSVALAHLAAKLSELDTQSQGNNIDLPLYFHVNDIQLPTSEDTDPLTCFISVLVAASPLILQKRLPTFLAETEKKERLILILDGLDECHPAVLRDYVKFLEGFIRKHPLIQIITSASLNFLDGLIQAGFQPLTLAAWSHSDRVNFIGKWGEAWAKQILPDLVKANQVSEMNPALINSWINENNLSLTPLEWTLYLWAIYGGDITGSRTITSIHAYVERTSGKLIPPAALQYLANKFVNEKHTALGFAEIESDLSKTSWTNQIPSMEESQRLMNNQASGKGKGKKLSSVGRIVDDLIYTGLLKENLNTTISFSHPLLLGYLASFQADEPTLDASQTDEPVWDINDALIHYQAAQGRAIDYIENTLLYSEPPLYANILRLSRWIKDIPTHLTWRTQVLRQLVQLLSNEDISLSLRMRFMSGILLTGDPSIPKLLKQLSTSPSPAIKQMASWGFGAIQDNKSIENLSILLGDNDVNTYLAAAYAIGISDSPTAQPILKDMIHSGSESISQAAAECLATTNAGHALLQEAIESDQILTRRAAVIGLAKVNTNWSMELIERIAVQDGQWVVRNVAGQIIESMKRHALYCPTPLPNPHDSPWLLEFAAKMGTGIAIGEPAIDILIKALQTGSQDQKMAAIRYLTAINNEEAITALYLVAQTEKDELGRAALNSLWLTNLSGIKITI